MSDTTIWLDTETYNDQNNLKNGTARYASTAEITVVSYALNDGDVQVWDVTSGLPIPIELYRALENPNNTIVTHNVMFDYNVMRTNHHIFGAKIKLPITRFYCTMVQAHAHGLPGALGTLSSIFNLGDSSKDKRGRALLMLFCKPNINGVRNTSKTHPIEWKAFLEYARQDIVAMRVLHKRMPRLNYPLDRMTPERELWYYDQMMNSRGIHIDMELVNAAVASYADSLDKLNESMVEATDGEVQSATEVASLRAFLLDNYNVDLPDLKASTVARRMEDPNLPQGVKELLAIRAETGKTAVAKYQVLERSVTSDGRLPCLIQFCGASRTGRDAGRQFQPQNLPRPTVSADEVNDLIEAAKAGCLDLVETKPVLALTNCLRGAITAPEGKKLVISDLSNIEGRVLVWLSGEEWKLEYFRDFDRGAVKYDNYVMAYAKSFGVDPSTVDKRLRQIGKVEELAFGYGGGVNGFLTFALVYRLDLEQVSEQARAVADPAQWQEIEDKYQWAVDNGYSAGLGLKAWAGCEYNKVMWRESHPRTVAWWAKCQEAFRQATENPGLEFKAGKFITMKRVKDWLLITLPSGRRLCYPQPKVGAKGRLNYNGINPYSHKWGAVDTYGGKLAENITQAVARDVLFYNIPTIEAKGYEIVLRVHDEFITETVDDEAWNVDELSRIMSTPHKWCETLPLAAAGFESYRYKKED